MHYPIFFSHMSHRPKSKTQYLLLRKGSSTEEESKKKVGSLFFIHHIEKYFRTMVASLLIHKIDPPD